VRPDEPEDGPADRLRQGYGASAKALATAEAGPHVLTDSSVERMSVAAATAGTAGWAIGSEGSDSTRLLGTLVHRIIERVTVPRLADTDEVRRQAWRLVREHERLEIEDLGTFVEKTVQMCALFANREDLREVYASGTPVHEVPFTLHDGSRYVRGTIDCLVRGVNGQLTVVEFKTGRQRAEHQEQAELYTRAVCAAFPGCVVEARIFYADRNHLHPGMV
jgi:hypothetical protein